MSILHLQEAADRILQAVANKKRIILISDSDVDGVTAALIMHEAVTSAGGRIEVTYFPNRQQDGYGLNPHSLQDLEKEAPALLVLMDLGIGNIQEIPQARAMGFSVVIIDHHIILGKVPAADVVVDPKQPGDPSVFKEYAACGLTFLTAEAMLKEKMSGELRRNLLELAALGTIADMMPREPENTVIIEEGLESMKTTWRPAFRAFFALPEFEELPNIESRVSQMISVLNVRDIQGGAPASWRLLGLKSEEEATSMVLDLMEQNSIRKEKTTELVEHTRRVLASKEPGPIIFEGGEEFEYILIPSVASILSNEYNKPTFIYSQEGDTVMGSVRAPKGYDTVEAMKQCADLFEAYGGHPQASGFRTNQERLGKIRESLTDYFGSHGIRS